MVDAPTQGKASCAPEVPDVVLFCFVEVFGSASRGSIWRNTRLWDFAGPIYNAVSETTLRHPASSVRFPTSWMLCSGF